MIKTCTNITITLLAISFTLIACNSYKNLKKGQSVLSFTSAFSNDTVNVKVNNINKLSNHKIDMIVELGVSRNSTIYVYGKEIKISGSFKTSKIVDDLLDLKFSRTLKFDTILKAKNGRYINIWASDKKVIIQQNKKIIKVE